MTKTMNVPVAAAATFVPTMPPVGYVHGDSCVLGTVAQRSAVFGVVMIADGVEGVLPRGVPV